MKDNAGRQIAGAAGLKRMGNSPLRSAAGSLPAFFRRKPDGTGGECT